MSNSYRQGSLGWWMDERRGEPDFRLTWEEVAERAGVSYMTLRRNAADPSKMRTNTRKGIEYALGWEPGSVEAILAGGEPTEQEPEPPSDEERTQAILDTIEQLRQEVLQLRGSGNTSDRTRRGA